MQKRTLICDHTEEKIEDTIKMIDVNLLRGDYVSLNNNLHLSKEAHKLDRDVTDTSFKAFIGEDGSVAMIEVSNSISDREYYGRDTEDKSISRLFSIINQIIER